MPIDPRVVIALEEVKARGPEYLAPPSPEYIAETAKSLMEMSKKASQVLNSQKQLEEYESMVASENLKKTKEDWKELAFKHNLAPWDELAESTKDKIAMMSRGSTRKELSDTELQSHAQQMAEKNLEFIKNMKNALAFVEEQAVGVTSFEEVSKHIPLATKGTSSVSVSKTPTELLGVEVPELSEQATLKLLKNSYKSGHVTKDFISELTGYTGNDINDRLGIPRERSPEEIEAFQKEFVEKINNSFDKYKELALNSPTRLHGPKQHLEGMNNPFPATKVKTPLDGILEDMKKQVKIEVEQAIKRINGEENMSGSLLTGNMGVPVWNRVPGLQTVAVPIPNASASFYNGGVTIPTANVAQATDAMRSEHVHALPPNPYFTNTGGFPINQPLIHTGTPFQVGQPLIATTPYIPQPYVPQPTAQDMINRQIEQLGQQLAKEGNSIQALSEEYLTNIASQEQLELARAKLTKILIDRANKLAQSKANGSLGGINKYKTRAMVTEELTNVLMSQMNAMEKTFGNLDKKDIAQILGQIANNIDDVIEEYTEKNWGDDSSTGIVSEYKSPVKLYAKSMSVEDMERFAKQKEAVERAFNKAYAGKVNVELNVNVDAGNLTEEMQTKILAAAKARKAAQELKAESFAKAFGGKFDAVNVKGIDSDGYVVKDGMSALDKSAVYVTKKAPESHDYVEVHKEIMDLRAKEVAALKVPQNIAPAVPVSKVQTVKAVVMSDATKAAYRIAAKKVSSLVQNLLVDKMLGSAKGKQRSALSEHLKTFFNTNEGKALISVSIGALIPQVVDKLPTKYQSYADTLATEFRVEGMTVAGMSLLGKIEDLGGAALSTFTSVFNEIDRHASEDDVKVRVEATAPVVTITDEGEDMEVSAYTPNNSQKA